LFYFDFKGQEIVLFAHYSGNAVLLDELRKGTDMHGYISQNVIFPTGCWGADMGDLSVFAGSEIAENAAVLPVFQEASPASTPKEIYKKQGAQALDRVATFKAIIRGKSKSLVFGVLYGMGVRKLAVSLGLPLEKAQTVLDYFYTAFPEIRALQEAFAEVARTPVYLELTENGETYRRRYPVYFARNMFGRIFHLTPETARKGLNYLIQSSGADLTKRAILRARKMLKGKKSSLLNTIHDELVFLISDDERHLVPEIARIMGDFPEVKAPLPIEIMWSRTNWRDKVAYHGE
jgi:DNA polymerase I-like protein with 3'-5' exonuclease and polymerase domains